MTNTDAASLLEAMPTVPGLRKPPTRSSGPADYAALFDQRPQNILGGGGAAAGKNTMPIVCLSTDEYEEVAGDALPMLGVAPDPPTASSSSSNAGGGASSSAAAASPSKRRNDALSTSNGNLDGGGGGGEKLSLADRMRAMKQKVGGTMSILTRKTSNKVRTKRERGKRDAPQQHSFGLRGAIR